MSYCPKCGREVEVGATFCPEDGLVNPHAIAIRENPMVGMLVEYL